jgi:hypothetical protein
MVALHAAATEHAADGVGNRPRRKHLAGFDVVGTAGSAVLKATDKVLEFDLTRKIVENEKKKKRTFFFIIFVSLSSARSSHLGTTHAARHALKLRRNGIVALRLAAARLLRVGLAAQKRRPAQRISLSEKRHLRLRERPK